MSDKLEDKTSPPSVSVVVPSYNHAQFVASTLRSIVNQTLQPAKLLVIDDGSTDESQNVIASVLKDCPVACELITRENRGLSATLNQGLELTGGDYFAYLSSDDIWLADFLEARIKLLGSRPKAVLAYGNAYFIDEKNRIVDCTADWAPYKDGEVRDMLLKTIGPMSPTVLYRRESLERYGWNESASLEDYELYLRLSLEGEFAFDPRVLSAWRSHEKNTSWNQEMMLQEHLNALRHVAASFGIESDELERLLNDVRFERAEDFLRIGEKSKASHLVIENFTLSSRLLPIIGRLILPYSAVSWWRRKKQGAATERYGSLDI